MNSVSGRKQLLVYFTLTPLFWVADLGLDLNLRVAGLESEAWRGVYYAALSLLTATVWLRPGLLPLLAVLEPAFNLALLLIGTWSDLIAMQQAAADGLPTALFGPGRLVNFLLSGGAWYLAFHSGLRTLGERE